MGRHGGRGATAPGPGTGGYPAIGTAPIPTDTVMTGEQPVYDPTTTAEAVLALIEEVSSLYAQAKAARATVYYLDDDTTRTRVLDRAAEWDTRVSYLYQALSDTIRAALPGTARPDDFLPVRPLSNGHVELHAHDTTGRRLVVLLTGAQALAVGAHLTAYAAVSLDRIGQKLDGGLPHLGAEPPLTAGNDTEVRP